MYVCTYVRMYKQTTTSSYRVRQVEKGAGPKASRVAGGRQSEEDQAEPGSGGGGAGEGREGPADWSGVGLHDSCVELKLRGTDRERDAVGMAN